MNLWYYTLSVSFVISINIWLWTKLRLTLAAHFFARFHLLLSTWEKKPIRVETCNARSQLPNIQCQLISWMFQCYSKYHIWKPFALVVPNMVLSKLNIQKLYTFQPLWVSISWVLILNCNLVSASEIAASWSPMWLKIEYWRPEFDSWSPVGDLLQCIKFRAVCQQVSYFLSCRCLK